MGKPTIGKKSTKKKMPPVQNLPPVPNLPPVQNVQGDFPMFSALGPMNAGTSSGIPTHQQAQKPPHNPTPSLPAPPAIVDPYGAPPPGVAALKPPTGMLSGTPNNQLAQTVGKKGTKEKVPPVQNVQAVFPNFSALGPMNAASGPSAGTSSGLSNNQQVHQTPSHSLAPSLPAPPAVMNPYGAPSSTGVAAQGKPPAGTSSNVPTHHEAQTPSHNPAPSLPAPPAVTQPLGEPSPTGLPPYGMSAKTIRKIAKRLAGEPPSPSTSPPPRMHYPNPAIAPETAEEHSIYPINSQGRRDRGDPEETLDTLLDEIDPEVLSRHPEFNLQQDVRSAGLKLWEQKGRPMAPTPARPAPAMSDMMRTLDEHSRNRSDREVSGGNPTPSQKGNETSMDLDESMDWDGAEDSEEESERDFTMFEDTPRDASLVTEREDLILPPYNQPNEPVQAPPLTALSSLPTWSPALDPDYQTEAQYNLKKWNDFRFKIPPTPAAIASLQQALEITRMDYWLRNPHERYPPVDDLLQYKGESYGSQHRRLQHAFCRLWREFEADGGPAPDLYRLPGWIFGFEACFWRPASWGMDKRSEVYNQGLAEMANEKNAKGLQRVNYRKWKARLEDQVEAVTAEAKTPLGLFAGSRGRQRG